MLKNIIRKSRIKSPWLLHFDCGSCNGCDIEVLACLTPLYDIERFGIINVGNPMHSDLLAGDRHGQSPQQKSAAQPL